MPRDPPVTMATLELLAASDMSVAVIDQWLRPEIMP
jgi:hypothetical protein